ncbi:FtsW/RodA/SpoVE family cell cycle protein, partial [Listeria monocytogenes]|nr:FtsW/RodA/SpoVE family cell cycle protein [Listeria monocytogenes]
QAIRFGLGFTAMFVVAQIPPRSYRFWAPFAYGGGLILLALVIVVGIEVQGAQRWLAFPIVGSFQPAEIMKLAVPAMIAWL